MFRDNVDLPSIGFAILSMLSLQYHPSRRFGEPIASHKTITLTSNISACLNQTRKIALPCCHTRNSPPIVLPFSRQFHCTLRLRKRYIYIYTHISRDYDVRWSGYFRLFFFLRATMKAEILWRKARMDD